MMDFMKTLLSLSVSGSLLVLILFLLRPFYKNKLSQRWQYYIWLVVIVRLLFPFTVDFDITKNIYGQIYSEFVHIETESNMKAEKGKAENSNITDLDNLIQVTSANNAEDTDAENLHPLQGRIEQLFFIIKNHIFYVWLVMALLLFTRKITAYQGFIRYLKAGCTEVNSLCMWEEMGYLLEKLHIKSNVRLYINRQVSSPLLAGLICPCIVLPSEKMGKTDFRNIISHELTHFKRKDMFYKWLVQITLCIHWFNPFVYLLAREMDRLCELSCDEAVIKKLDNQGKKEYGNTLLKMADSGNTLKDSIASVTLSEGKKLLKERLERIMGFKKKTMIYSIVTAALTLALCVTATAMGNVDQAETDNKVQLIQNQAKDNLYQKALKNSNKENPIDKLIAQNRVILEDSIYHILCDGVKKSDISSGSVSDGCIEMVLEQSDGGYASIGPVNLKKDLDDLVNYTKKVCKKWIKSKTVSQKEAELMIGLAEKLVAGNGKIKGVEDTKNNSRISEYIKWNIKKKNSAYYYKNKRVRVFVDLRSDKSIVEYSYDKKGTVDVKVTRNKKGTISKVKRLSKKEADKFLKG